MSRAEDIEKCAAHWIAREDNAGSVDLDALESWLAQDIAHRIAYLRLRYAWQRANSLATLRVPLLSKKRRLPRRIELPAAMLVAAAVLICIGGTALLFYLHTNGTYVTAVGQQETIRLDDGSRVELNTDTSIQTKVQGNIRAVTLDRGQAYFEVAHDSKRPFVVLAGNRRITDLGTKFSVQRNDDDVEVIVKEGKVRIDVLNAALYQPPVFADGGKIVVAKADETLIATKGQQEIAEALDWRFGVLVFNKRTLADIATEFNRYNERKIVVEGSARDIRVGGSFAANNVDVFVQLVQQGFGLTVNSTDTEIVISK